MKTEWMRRAGWPSDWIKMSSELTREAYELSIYDNDPVPHESDAEKADAKVRTD